MKLALLAEFNSIALLDQANRPELLLNSESKILQYFHSMSQVKALVNKKNSLQHLGNLQAA